MPKTVPAMLRYKCVFVECQSKYANAKISRKKKRYSNLTRHYCVNSGFPLEHKTKQYFQRKIKIHHKRNLKYIVKMKQTRRLVIKESYF